MSAAGLALVVGTSIHSQMPPDEAAADNLIDNHQFSALLRMLRMTIPFSVWPDVRQLLRMPGALVKCICRKALSLYIMPCNACDDHAGEYCHLCGRAAGVQHSHTVPSSQHPFHLRQAGQVKR